MRIRQLFFGVLLSLSFISTAQSVKKEVLFTIDDKPYYTDEFSRVYNKNLDLVKDESQKDLTQYLELFIGYKLKIAKANKLGLQNGDSYKNELSSYRTQLSKNYLSDSKVTKELVEEGYQRSLKEVKAAHILLTCDENAAPEDTLKAYNKIVDIRNRVLKGRTLVNWLLSFLKIPLLKTIRVTWVILVLSEWFMLLSLLLSKLQLGKCPIRFARVSVIILSKWRMFVTIEEK